MLKVSVGTLALLAAPADQQQETPPPAVGAAGEATPPLQPPQSDSQGGGDGGGGDAGGGDDGDNKWPMRARQGAFAVLSASVRSQLELLGDLSRVIGHAEAALVCASLLVDAADATATLE